MRLLQLIARTVAIHINLSPKFTLLNALMTREFTDASWSDFMSVAFRWCIYAPFIVEKQDISIVGDVLGML
jgi:hypothetical protein